MTARRGPTARRAGGGCDRAAARRPGGRAHAVTPVPFTCAVVPERGDARVALEGHLDVATVGEVGSTLEGLFRTGRRHVVLDLSRLGFIDSTGVQHVVRWVRDARAAGRTLSVVMGPSPVEAVFRLTGTRDLL